MSFDPRKVHEFAKSRDADGNEEYRLVRINPYISISANGGPQVFLSDGQVYSADKKVIPESEWPGWLPGEIEKLSPKARAKVGFAQEGDLETKRDALETMRQELSAARQEIEDLKQGFSRPEAPVEPPVESDADKAHGDFWPAA